MTYATQAHLVERFGDEELIQLSDRSIPPLGGIDAAVVAVALADADGIIDSHLGARYAVPLAAPLPADIVRVACDIARYQLHDLSPSEAVREHYRDALRWLRDLADGKLPLIGDGGAIVSPKSSAFGPTVRPYENGAFGSAFAEVWLP